MARSSVKHRFFFLFVVFCLPVLLHAQEPVPLEPGEAIQREITGGQTHTYQIALTAGQFMHIVVEQKAIDVALRLTAPDGKQVVEVNLTGAGGLESLCNEAGASGDYRLTVRAIGLATLAGAYRTRLEVKTAATAEDKRRLTAEALMIETSELGQQAGKTAEQVIDKLQQALLMWRELGDQYWPPGHFPSSALHTIVWADMRKRLSTSNRH